MNDKCHIPSKLQSLEMERQAGIDNNKKMGK